MPLRQNYLNVPENGRSGVFTSNLEMKLICHLCPPDERKSEIKVANVGTHQKSIPENYLVGVTHLTKNT